MRRLGCRHGTAARTALAGVATADSRAIRALTIDAAAGHRFRRGNTTICETEHTSTSQSCRRQDGWNGKRTHDYLSHRKWTKNKTESERDRRSAHFSHLQRRASNEELWSLSAAVKPRSRRPTNTGSVTRGTCQVIKSRGGTGFSETGVRLVSGGTCFRQQPHT